MVHRSNRGRKNRNKNNNNSKKRHSPKKGPKGFCYFYSSPIKICPPLKLKYNFRSHSLLSFPSAYNRNFNKDFFWSNLPFASRFHQLTHTRAHAHTQTHSKEINFKFKYSTNINILRFTMWNSHSIGFSLFIS